MIRWQSNSPTIRLRAVSTLPGPPGERGEPGPTPSFTIGTVTTVAPGGSATASITGTDADPILNLGIPEGEQGDPGAPGAAATIAAGTTTTGVEGTSASVANSGSSSAATFDFTIPRGAIPATGFNFSTTTTDSDPGSGNVRFNNATPASVTAIYFDNVDRDGNTVTSWLDSFDDSTTSAKGTLTITPAATPSAKLIYAVSSSVVDGTGYRKVTVTHVAGTTLPSNAAHLAFTFSRSGDKGTDGLGAGDVVGPGSATDNAVARFDNTTGKLIQNSAVTIADTTGVIAGTQGVTFTGSSSGTTALVPAAAASGTLTLPAATDTLVGKATTDTLTNKTLTSPVVSGGTIDDAVIGGSTPAAATFTLVTADGFAPTSSTATGNRMLLSAANTLGWSINGTAEMLLTSTALTPAADGGNSLGSTTLGWQNLFGNTGFVINIENGDWVFTHTAGIGTVGTGDLRVTTAGTNSASVVTVGGTQTLTNKTLTSPTINGSTLGGVHDAGGATSFEIPNSATPTVDADGEIAVDTTVTDFSHGILKYYSGEELGVVAMPIAQFTSPTNNYVVTYDSTADEFQLKAASGGGGGSYVLISKQTASSSASLAWTGLDTSTYDSFEIVFDNIVPASAFSVALLVQFGTGGTPTWQTSGYVNVGASTAGVSGYDFIGAADLQMSNTAGYGASGNANFGNLAASARKMVSGNATGYTSVPKAMVFSGLYDATTAITAVRLIFTSGNITSGIASLFGRKNS